MGTRGHKLSEYIKLNEKKDKRFKKYKSKKVAFSLHSENKLQAAEPWI